MIFDFKRPYLGKKSLIILIATAVVLSGVFPFIYRSEIKADESSSILVPALPGLLICHENALLPVASLNNPSQTKTIPVIVTAYSSTPGETDDSPFVTAAGTSVRNGVVANNYLAFGTKIKIPEIYGDKVFVVEDRMNWKKGNYQIDIWFPSYEEAKNFGAKRTYIEVLES